MCGNLFNMMEAWEKGVWPSWWWGRAQEPWCCRPWLGSSAVRWWHSWCWSLQEHALY